MSAEILALLDPATPDTWPQGILAAADLREQRATLAAAGGQWHVDHDGYGDLTLWSRAHPDDPKPVPLLRDYAVDRVVTGSFEHIAAEASPAHALAAVRRWRGVAGRHRHYISERRLCANNCPGRYPCDDLTETADEARAYLGGAS